MVVQMSFVKMGGNDYLVLAAPHLPCQFQSDFMALFGRYFVWLEALVTVPCNISAYLLGTVSLSKSSAARRFLSDS